MIKNKNILKIGKDVIKTEINALKKLQKSIQSSFYKSVELIEKSKGNIVFTGVGKSKLILEKTCGTFSSLGLTSYTLDPTAANHGDLGRLQQKDILIIASNSGASKEFEPILKYAKKINIKIIGITSNSSSELSKNATINIIHPKVTEAGNKNFSLVPTSSTTLLSALGDALAIAVASKKKFEKKSFGLFHPMGSIGKQLATVDELLIPKSKLIFVNKNTNFADTLSKISTSKLGCILINNKTKKISICTDGDCARAAYKYKNLQKIKVKDFMTKKPITIDSKTLIKDALTILNNRRVKVLLVYKKNKFAGLINLYTIWDFLNK
jgi:arabinose-5-phosphate isomerase